MLSDIFIDGCPTVAEFVSEEEDATESDTNNLIRQNEEWHLKHIKESKYLLQIRKCDDLSCCSVKRSSLFRVIKDGFIPPPIPIQQTKNGQFCHQDRPSISPYSKYRDRALVAAKLAPKW